MQTRTRGAGIAAVLLVLVGVLLLLNNYLIITGINLTSLWPLLLVAAGIALLIQGDLTPTSGGRTFGITRGSVESATAEISAGEIDVRIAANLREGRLVAGQYAANSRPSLEARGSHAHLRMDRAATPWLSFSDWELGLARDLPWRLVVSTHLGSVDANLNDVVLQEAHVITGIGDIRFTLPAEAFDPIQLRSSLGDIHVMTPPGTRARVHLRLSRMSQLFVDSNRYERTDDMTYQARAAESVFQPIDVYVTTMLGDVYLA